MVVNNLTLESIQLRHQEGSSGDGASATDEDIQQVNNSKREPESSPPGTRCWFWSGPRGIRADQRNNWSMHRFIANNLSIFHNICYSRTSLPTCSTHIIQALISWKHLWTIGAKTAWHRNSFFTQCFSSITQASAPTGQQHHNGLHLTVYNPYNLSSVCRRIVAFLLTDNAFLWVVLTNNKECIFCLYSLYLFNTLFCHWFMTLCLQIISLWSN